MFTKAAFATALLCAFASQAQAGGFQLTEQSALSMGRAYAGAGVDGQDISGVFYNPASMTLDQGTRFQLGTIVADLNLAYESSKLEGYPGKNDNGRAAPTPIPFAYAAHQLNDTVQLGLAITAPFGLETEFSDNWDQSFRGISSELQVVDINPSIAFKLSDKFSVGFGVSAQYANAKLKYNAARILSYQFKQKSPELLNNPKTKPLVEPLKELLESKQIQQAAAADPVLDIHVKDWTWGWNVGMLWQPVDTVRVGLSYRSSTAHKAKGTAKAGMLNNPGLKEALANQQGILNAMPALGINGDAIKDFLKTGSTNASIAMDAPAWAMLSASWDINPTYTWSGMVRWSRWSTFKSLDLELTDLNFKHQQPTEWRDTWFVSTGLDAHINDKLTVRGGIGYESGVIKNPVTRSGAIPDADRVWLTAGASYKFTKNLKTDFSAAYVRGVGERGIYDDKGAQIGRFEKLDGILLGAQVQYRF